MRKFLKILLYITLAVLAVVLIFFIYFNLPVKAPDKKAELGVTFSARYARDIGLDPQETLAAILDDLKVKNIRIPVYWDQVEPEKDKYNFSDIDWQLAEAERARAKVILVIGQKVPRWPECFIPEWAGDDEGLRRQGLINLITAVVNRYKGNNTVYYWQIENEPFLPFGICPPFDSNLLDLEIAAARAIDPNRKILITDSGELSLWIPAARRADIFGTTLYRSVVTEKFGGLAFDYPLGPNFFRFKYRLIKKFAKQENIMIVELQGEPWLDGWTTDQPLAEQLQSMDAKKLRENVRFAEKTGFSPILLWGAEWWYWLKEKQDYPQLWEEARGLFYRQQGL